MKKVKYLLPAETIDMGGFPVKQSLPTQHVPQWDPFLLLHHASIKYSQHRLAKHQGVGPHPHRGFSPVTFVVEGEVHHRDSRGNNQIARTGEVQWMNAGMGIIHSERPSQSLVEERGRQEIVQLWINSPSDKKLNPPKYQYFSENEISTFHSSDEQIRNKLIAGKYDKWNGKFNTESELLIIWSDAKGNSKQTYHVPEEFNSMLYLIKGTLNIGGYGIVEKEHLVVFEEKGDKINITVRSNAQFLILAGLPLDEEVVQSGPFVMNSQTEILEAMRDYRVGKMGVLIEED